MVKTLSILLLLVAFIAVCYSEESDQLKEKSTLLDKLISNFQNLNIIIFTKLN